MFFFQNCKNQIAVTDAASRAVDSLENGPEGEDHTPADIPPISMPPTTGLMTPPVTTCQLISCLLDPITMKPAVTTILLALGDQANAQLVIGGASAQLIAETVIRYTTPVKNPKILVVKDMNSQSEDPEDLIYLTTVLLSRYNVEKMDEPANGLTLEQIESYDLVWLNNPGHTMGSKKTMNTLIAFTGGVVLQGDDLARGNDFSTESLTKLRFIDNGVSVVCNEQEYSIDNNESGQFLVSLNSQFFPLAQDQSSLFFYYGNDIDETEVASSEVEVLATARGNQEDCEAQRPAIVRYFK